MNETRQQHNHTTSCADVIAVSNHEQQANMKSLKSIHQRKTPKATMQTSYKLIPTN